MVKLKKMIMIVVILVVLFFVFYFITTLVINPSENENQTNEITEIDKTKITINHLLDRNESEYYVLATMESMYPHEINYKEIYNKYINDYTSKDNALKFYSVDLDDALNKSYLGEKMNITNKLVDLKINDEVLFKIKNGKIENYYVGNSKIVDFLSNL